MQFIILMDLLRGQHTADGFHVYAVLEGYCGEGMA